MALIADLTREEHRTKAMAVIGMTIGMSFLAAMVLGPLLNVWIGVPGIFWMTAGLAVAGIVILLLFVPRPDHLSFHRDTEVEPARFHEVLADTQLLRLDLGILTLHMVLTASFVALPLLLRDAGFAPESHMKLYLPVMVLAMLAMVPFIIIAEKKHKMKQVLLGAIAVLIMTQLVLMSQDNGSIMIIAVMLWLFFSAFNLLEASLPSLVSKFAPAQNKGTAMGIYSSSQFVGAFFGGLLGGWSYGWAGAPAVFALCAVMLAAWFIAALTMKQPRYLATTLVNVGDVDSARARELEQEISGVKGVAEVSINVDDGVAYLKVDSRVLDEEHLEQFSVSPA
jgi:predicted MFS family arabinose efflux permease